MSYSHLYVPETEDFPTDAALPERAADLRGRGTALAASRRRPPSCASRRSAVSHQIKLLEAELGIELFVRRAHGIELSRQGRAYFPILRDAFERIAAGTDLLRGAAAQPRLTLQVYSTFAIRWLIPRLPAFSAATRRSTCGCSIRSPTSNFEYEDVDACVMIGNRSAAGLRYDYLYSSRDLPDLQPGSAGRVPSAGPSGAIARGAVAAGLSVDAWTGGPGSMPMAWTA